MNATSKSSEKSKPTETRTESLSEEERAAIKERAAELKKSSRRGRGSANVDGESDVLAKIAEMSPPDRALAERLHAIITAAAPGLSPKTWYGMPGYAKEGNIVCFFQSAVPQFFEVAGRAGQRQGASLVWSRNCCSSASCDRWSS